MKEPSKKQVKYAKDIARTLGIDLPTEYTSYHYWKFIKENRSKCYWKKRDQFYSAYEEDFEDVYSFSDLC